MEGKNGRIDGSIRQFIANSISSTVVATIGATLPAGSYYVQFSLQGSLASGPFVPPISILGTTVTGNGYQSLVAGTWSPVADPGNPQGFPFLINGVAAAGLTGNE